MHTESNLLTQPPSRKTSGGTDGVLSSMDQDSRIEVQGRRIKPPERPLVLQMVGYRPALMRIKTKGLRVRCLGQIPIKKRFFYFPKDQASRNTPDGTGDGIYPPAWNRPQIILLTWPLASNNLSASINPQM